jgi:hypothetical protein
MGARGPKAVADQVEVFVPGRRPEPPPELVGEARAEWERVTAALPAGWFTTETHALLTLYCQHVAHAKWLAQAISRVQEQIDAGGDTEEQRRHLKQLLASHAQQTMTAASLATKLRLTKKSRYMRRSERAAAAVKSSPSTGRRPWEDWGRNRQ